MNNTQVDVICNRCVAVKLDRFEQCVQRYIVEVVQVDNLIDLTNTWHEILGLRRHSNTKRLVGLRLRKLLTGLCTPALRTKNFHHARVLVTRLIPLFLSSSIDFFAHIHLFPLFAITPASQKEIVGLTARKTRSFSQGREGGESETIPLSVK